MPDLSTEVGVANETGWAYDPTRNQLDIITSDGTLKIWSIADQKMVASIQIGGSPRSVDISPDGQYLVIGNRTPIVTSSPFAFDKTYADQLTRVNLQTLTTDAIVLPLQGSWEQGIAHVAIAADGATLFTTDFAGSGWNPFREFPGGVTYPGFSLVPGLGSITQSSYLIPSEDRRYILVEENNISDGPLHIYDSATGQITASTDLYRLGTSGFQHGGGDINSAAGLVVDVIYQNVYVLDLALRPVANLSLYTSYDHPIIGGVFNTGGHQLFLSVDGMGGERKTLVIDTQSWLQVGSFSVNFAGAHLQVIDGGRTLAYDTGSGLELIDLAARLHVNIAADAVAQLEYGALGDDSLAGGGGGDTLVGMAGQDTLSGGSGANLFVFHPGDSTALLGATDVITDWAAGDHLSFGAVAANTLTYWEALASSFSAAADLAGQQIAAGGVDYVAVAVGADVIVFADGRGENAISDAVLLQGTGLLAIDASAIVADPLPASAAGIYVPPAGPAGSAQATAADDQLRAGPGASEIHAGAGNDTIQGWAANSDYLRGDDGNDSIQGGSGFDDINGNKGDDTIDGGSGGGDWLVGGQGNDAITSHGSPDILYGNLGNDTLIGGWGDEILRGGQGDDHLSGGDGNDWLSGDRGFDVITGGPGADIFHTFSGAGVDYVTDFSLTDRDRVQLDAGTSYAVKQDGANVVIDMGGGDQMILENVQLSTLPASWIFTA